ncbi:cellulose synthase [Mesorhizobium sp. CN2-181]|uniref:cellulose synthase n=1 Tax=Mesorhizobium yinganensis TaxID=3157707 RepID=UPI0032B77F7E
MRVPSIIWLVAGAAVVGYFGLRDNKTADGFFQSRATREAAGTSQPGTTDRSSQSGTQTAQLSPSAGTGGQTVPAAPPATVNATPSPQAPAPAPSTAATGQAPAVDETALRYFARRGDSKRLEAEIARLRTLYPDWTPPSDPSAVVPLGDVKLDDMWQLYSENRYAEVRKAIADRVAAEPAWRPPQDLLDRLTIAEARDRLVNASNLKQSEMVIRIAANTPSLLTCSEVDVLWRVAEAFAVTDRTGRARDAFLYILKNCTDQAERLATVEKAIPVLSRDEIADLLATERIGPDGKGEFEAAKIDLARRSVAAAGEDPKVTVPPSDVGAVEAVADKDGQASDAILLGWYYLGRDNPTAAEKWFRKARGVKDTAEVSQGLALALVGLGRYAEAEDVLFPWNDSSDEARKVYLAAVANLLGGDPPAMIEPAMLQRMAPVVGKARDAAAAQQFGWYARALNQHRTAGQWFTAALSWKPDDEPSAYGLALTRLQLKDAAGVAEIQRLWAGRSERIATLGEIRRDRQRPGTLPAPPAQAGAASPIAERQTYGDTAEAPARVIEASEQVRPAQGSGSGSAKGDRLQRNRSCKTTQAYSNLGGSASLARGWCLMEMKRPLEAIKAFENAMERGDATVQRDAAYGQSLAYLRVGLSNDAAVAAAKAPQDRKRTLELDEALLSRRASDFFGAGRYAEAILALDQRARIAPERIDLMAMRGYAYLNLRRKEDARRIFRAIAATGDREGLRGLKAVDPPKDNN